MTTTQFAETKSGKPIGGWLLKANPHVFDVVGNFDEEGVILYWTLNQTYRVDLLQPGQPVFLWIGLGDDDEGSGLLGVGTVRTEAHAMKADLEAWADQSAAEKVRVGCGFWIERLTSPVPRAEFTAHPLLASTELIKSRQMGNPIALTPDEVDAIRDTFDLSTIHPTDDQARQAKERIAMEQADDMPIMGAMLPGLSVALEFDDEQEDGFLVVASTGDADESQVWEFGDFIVAAAHLAALCEAAVASAPVVPEPKDDDEEFDIGGVMVVELGAFRAIGCEVRREGLRSG